MVLAKSRHSAESKKKVSYDDEIDLELINQFKKGLKDLKKGKVIEC